MNKLLHATLNALKTRIALGQLNSFHRGFGYTKECKFSFYKAATSSEMEDFIEKTETLLPDSYEEFLLIHNGAILFEVINDEYDYTNWLVFGHDEISEYREKDIMPEYMYPIAKYDQTLICVNEERLKEGREDYLFDRTIYSGAGEDGEDMKLNFELWLERLIIAQGEHFWFWDKLNATNYEKEFINNEEDINL